MNKILCRIGLTLSILFATNSFALTIKSIEILGNNAISKETVLSYLPVSVGDDFNDDVSNVIIKTLYKTQFFHDIEVAQNNQILTVTVTEKPHIKYIDLLNYSNNDVLSDESIKELLKDMQLSKGKIFNKRQLQKLISHLQNLYISKGYYNININESVITDSQNRVGIEINISEGAVAKIKSMNIVGAKVHSEKDLLDLFDIGEPNLWIINYFTKKDHFSQDLLDIGIESMSSLYINSGYLDFAVLDTKVDLSNENASVDIVIEIKEGFQFKLGNVSFSGESLDIPTSNLIRSLGLAKEDVFRRNDLLLGIKNISDIFANRGYAFVDVKPVTTQNLKEGYIDLNLDITLNKKVYINRINISGNTRTQDDVIRREIGISEGGIYSKSELDNSVTKLKRLGFFSDVQMEVFATNDFADRINLKFSVVETKTGSFTAGISHSSSTGSAFSIGIKERNVLGTGNVLNAKINTSKAVTELSAYFSDPYFTEDKHSISYGLFHKKVDAANLDVSSYEISETGASFGYGIPLTEDTRINGDLAYSTKNLTCSGDLAVDEQAQCSSTDKNEVKANVNWSNNTLDNYLYPTEGSSNSVSLDLALPLGDFQYYKIDTSHKSYYPLGNDNTFSLKGSAGIASGYGGKELPFFERYYGGGSGSVRGFDFNSLGAKYANGKPKGGEVSLSTSASVISPMDFIEDSENMRMSAFVDAGGIYDNTSSITLNELRMSAGVAFYWMTPIGPIGIFAAKPLIKKAGDQTKSIQVTIGSSF